MIGFPVSSTIRTTPSRNSRSYFFRFSDISIPILDAPTIRGDLSTLIWTQRFLAEHTQTRHDDLWLVDSTPIECGRSVETVKRSALAGYAEYGYCASHSRWFWGMRLHLVTTGCGLPICGP